MMTGRVLSITYTDPSTPADAATLRQSLSELQATRMRLDSIISLTIAALDQASRYDIAPLPQPTDRERIAAAQRAAAKAARLLGADSVSGRQSARYAWQGTDFLHQPVYFDHPYGAPQVAQAFVAEARRQGLPVVWDGTAGRSIAVLPTRVALRGDEPIEHRHYVASDYAQAVTMA